MRSQDFVTFENVRSLYPATSTILHSTESPVRGRTGADHGDSPSSASKNSSSSFWLSPLSGQSARSSGSRSGAPRRISAARFAGPANGRWVLVVCTPSSVFLARLNSVHGAFTAFPYCGSNPPTPPDKRSADYWYAGTSPSSPSHAALVRRRSAQ